MHRENTELIKIREVSFCAINPDPKQAHTATLLLSGMEGVIHAHPLTDNLLQVRYDIGEITLQVIEEVLGELGFHLSNNLMNKLKRALYYYPEETQRANLGLDEAWAVRIVKQVGNYGESFERNVGLKTPLGLARGLNELWTKGGLQYSPPFH